MPKRKKKSKTVFKSAVKRGYRLPLLILVIFITSGASVFLFLKIKSHFELMTSYGYVSERSPLMERIKTKGCIADGLLSDYGNDTDNLVALINRSECQYLHRSLETWAAPPDFKRAQEIKGKITKPDTIYGMFLAEAIYTYIKYDFPDEQRSFDPHKMCRQGSHGFWGKGTCKAYFGSDEYREYIKYITRRAIDMDIQSFLFGQIVFQEGRFSNPYAPRIVAEMREYAASQGKQIVVGAQTNDISHPEYLKIFDYIEGGVGIHDDGRIEKGPCSSRWWKKEGDRCWALVWHEKYASNANDVLVHFDWSGIHYDDMSTFARMSKEERTRILNDMDAFFSKRSASFLMPFLAVMYRHNGSCYGPNPEFYSPSNSYSCKDEDVMNEILRRNNTTEIGIQ